MKFSLNWCSTLIPVKRLFCCPKMVLFSTDAEIGIPDASSDLSKIITRPN